MASVKEIKQLTARDLAFGIGRKATSEEVKQLIESTKNDNFVSLEKFEKKLFKKTKNSIVLANKVK